MTTRQKIDKIIEKALVLIMGVMVINVLWQVFSRYIVGIPSSFTDELARFLMIWVGILGAAYVSGQNMHVAIDVIPSRCSPKNKRLLSKIVGVAIILFAIAGLIIGGFRLVYITYILNQYSPALQIPLALVYIVIPLSGILIIYYKTNDFLNN